MTYIEIEVVPNLTAIVTEARKKASDVAAKVTMLEGVVRDSSMQKQTYSFEEMKNQLKQLKTEILGEILSRKPSQEKGLDLMSKNSAQSSLDANSIKIGSG